MNEPLGLPTSVVVVVGVTVVVVTGGAVVVLVAPQAPSHASQQLLVEPTQAEPPFGALHLSALFLVEHFTLPRRSMRQQVTASGFPHVDLAAQRTTSPLHSAGKVPAPARSFATAATQLTYWP